MSVQIRSGTSGNLADVNANKELQVALNSSASSAGYARVVNSRGLDWDVGEDGLLRVGQKHAVWGDTVEGATLNTNLWTTSTSTMTITQTGGVITLNAGSSTATGTYAILLNNKYFSLYKTFPTIYTFRARVIPKANAVVELGIGAAATTAAPTDGIFFRFDSTGTTCVGVISFGGVEQTTATISTLDSSKYYTFKITHYGDQVRFEIILPGVGTASQTVSYTSTYGITHSNPSPTSATRLQMFTRVYNTGVSPSSAAQLLLGSCAASQLDMASERTWRETAASMARHIDQSPVSTFSQTTQWANTTQPTTGALSNTAALFTTLGGLFIFNAPATSTTDGIIFGFQVPTGFQLVVTEIWIQAVNTGAAVATTATVLEWAAAVNSSAVSLATADGTNTWQPRRVPLGITSWAIAAAVGAAPAQPDIMRNFSTPLVCESGRYFHILVKPLIGTATASQTISGIVGINGYWE